MKRIKNILLLIIAASITACGGSSAPQQERASINQQTGIVETYKPAKADLINFSKSDVARFAISSIMGQSSKNIKVRSENELYYVSYMRKSDSKKFDYKIKIDGNTLVWANVDGRWRDGEYDERISFEETGNRLKIYQTFSDGSIEIKEYKIGD
ncbi:hypothetical protein [Pedobacter insulae]|nr:hypothetical protein [Pedobacter insulae]